MSELWLYSAFFYIGLVTIGGGQVAIPIMQQKIVSKGLISPEDFYSMIAISESTPGPIGINAATFIGYRLFGIRGGIFATASCVLPSLITIILIAKFFEKKMSSPLVKSAFYGLRPATTGMIFCAILSVWKISLIDVAALREKNFASLVKFPQIAFFAAALAAIKALKASPFFILIAGAIFGAIFL